MSESLTICNHTLEVQIDPLGAELKSICSRKTQMEYLWQPGYDIWDHSSLLLFPNAARIASDRILVDGKAYPATMHGFAYTSLFTVVQQSGDAATLELCANARTRRYFPYAFRLRVTFRLEGDTLIQQLEVCNEDTRTMYFSIGAHPGFYLPLEVGESGNDYLLRFDRPQQIEQLYLEKGTSLLTHDAAPFLRQETDVSLCEEMFDEGPILLSNVSADSITLLSRKSGHYVKLGIRDFPYLCLWGNPHKNAMICMEPWCGVSDYTDTDHIWEKKRGIEQAAAGKTFSRELTFQVG
jgi:galactose mutarotase-like enzyme